jgi:hypothetical protein
MKALLAFLLVPAGIVAYLFPALAWGVYQRYPVASFAICALGVYFLARLAWATFSVGRVLLSIAGVALLAGFAYFTLVAWVYEGTDTNLKTGDSLVAPSSAAPPGGASLVAAPPPAPIVLKTAAGAPFDLAKEVQSAPATVVVFYRGFW